ncbi:hypothetical protein BH10CHL1_BH10CHL1_03430 [soil metagenome]
MECNTKDLVFIKELLETGKIAPVIDRRYPLAETAEAIRYLETGHARGKVIITLAHHNKTHHHEDYANEFRALA